MARQRLQGASEIEKAKSPQMFDKIAHRYDVVNSLISMGQHARWRRAIQRRLPNERSEMKILDLATGTGDVAIALASDPRVKVIYGVDLSQKMLDFGRRKILDRGLTTKIKLLPGDAMKLDFEDDSFDVVTMSFGIRNVPSVETCLSEALRVLKPGGRMIVLESGMPSSGAVKWLHLQYIRRVVPALGGIFSGQSFAYRYLNKTIEDFPWGKKFVRLMERCGYGNCQSEALLMGSVYLYWGDK